MNNIRWANTDCVGICYDNSEVVVYVDSGPVYDAIINGHYGPIGEPAIIVTPPVPLTPDQIEALRKAAYQDEADPLFFKWQRGESTEAAWLAKIAEIKARYPEPEA